MKKKPSIRSIAMKKSWAARKAQGPGRFMTPKVAPSPKATGTGLGPLEDFASAQANSTPYKPEVHEPAPSMAQAGDHVVEGQTFGQHTLIKAMTAAHYARELLPWAVRKALDSTEISDGPDMKAVYILRGEDFNQLLDLVNVIDGKKT